MEYLGGAYRQANGDINVSLIKMKILILARSFVAAA